MRPEIVFIGDDFTGAADSLAAYARGGSSARLVTGPLGLERLADPPSVLGIATDLRAQAPGKARETVDRIWPLVSRHAPRILHLKVCSTFHSSPTVGSIGAAATAVAERFRPDVTAVIGGQPSLGRNCAFGNLFARGPDGAVHRIDRHPVMARHPVTPMGEADLVRHLAAQGLEPLQRIAVTELDDPEALAARLRQGPALLDVMAESDQRRIGAALRRAGGRQLLIGASSVAEILASPSPARQEPGDGPLAAGRQGAVLALAGSRSSITARQVAACTRLLRVRLDRDKLDDPGTAGRLAERLAAGQALLLHLDPDADYGRSSSELADACARLAAGIMARQPLRALALPGGDTSGRVTARLGFDALDYLRDLGPGVTLCLERHRDVERDGMAIMLKGGQMGPPDLFDRFADLVGV